MVSKDAWALNKEMRRVSSRGIEDRQKEAGDKVCWAM